MFTRKVIMWCLVAIWMGLIFYMSAMTGDESGAFSGRITWPIVRFIFKDFESYSPDRQDEIMSTASLIVRKLAHFTEYFVLCFLVIHLLLCYNVNGLKLYMAAIIWSALYAATDEYHQGFTAGRGPAVMDVLIDTSGAVVAALFLGLIFLLKKRKTRHAV